MAAAASPLQLDLALAGSNCNGARRKQLGYVSREPGFIDAPVADGAELSERQMAVLQVIHELHTQQFETQEKRTRKVENRIVSIEQPWARPIVRGKTHANTEFGAKMHLCIEDGWSIVEHMSFDAYNEAARLVASAEAYFERHGHWPERILADKIYLNRSNSE